MVRGDYNYTAKQLSRIPGQSVPHLGAPDLGRSSAPTTPRLVGVKTPTNSDQIRSVPTRADHPLSASGSGQCACLQEKDGVCMVLQRQ
jgi:hypothetical protein